MRPPHFERDHPFWLLLALLGVAFWALVVVAWGEWLELRAWAGLGVAVVVFLWRYVPGVFETERD